MDFVKIKPALLLSLIILMVMAPSCIRKRNSSTITIQESLQQSANELYSLATREYESLTDKLEDARTSETAAKSQPVWSQLMIQGDCLRDFIKTLLNKETITKEDITRLYNGLVNFKLRSLLGDEDTKQAFAHSLAYWPETKDYGINTAGQFRSFYFEGKPSTESRVQVTKFLVDINMVTYKLLAYFNQKTYPYDDSGFPYYVPTIKKNASVFEPGDELVITTGISAYSASAGAKFTIDGKNILPGIGRYAEYNKKVPLQPGMYEVPVIISYLNQVTGKEEIISSVVKYKVAKICSGQQ